MRGRTTAFKAAAGYGPDGHAAWGDLITRTLASLAVARSPLTRTGGGRYRPGSGGVAGE